MIQLLFWLVLGTGGFTDPMTSVQTMSVVAKASCKVTADSTGNHQGLASTVCERVGQ